MDIPTPSRYTVTMRHPEDVRIPQVEISAATPEEAASTAVRTVYGIPVFHVEIEGSPREEIRVCAQGFDGPIWIEVQIAPVP